MFIEMHHSDVVGLLKRHRQAHVEEYNKQLEGWQKAMEDHAIELNKWAAAGGTYKERPHEPDRPDDFADDYDEYLDMLTHHIGETVRLTSGDFKQIVKDEFGWKHGFLHNSTLYSGRG